MLVFIVMMNEHKKSDKYKTPSYMY